MGFSAEGDMQYAFYFRTGTNAEGYISYGEKADHRLKLEPGKYTLSYSVDFEITTAANYLLRWYMPKASAGMNEGLVGNIRLVLHSEDTSVDTPEDQLTGKSIIKIFNPQGQQIPQLQRGVNIVVHADGTTSKVYK